MMARLSAWPSEQESGSAPASPHTASAAVSVKLPTNTPTWQSSAARQPGVAHSSRRSWHGSSGGGPEDCGSRRQERQPLLETLEQDCQPQHLGPRGGELDGQRQAVKARAQRRNGARRSRA